ncbi:hypothetical protein Poli38472_006646 [Pythium oligandrum]|uniref:Uncharacterized protein n=1 Tax=Pythium oligandrum TaxID=41045 RepID=A0A8K1C557_PYTOL|nr:hypothetical protein Poli38472_006646 [Pythium oligandrum]|eukprot:TMW56636.1 hypothetical protein Poli38472_006646 [Pythium oligandrum]
MMELDRSDPQLEMLFSPMTQRGQERFARARAAIRQHYGPAAQLIQAQQNSGKVEAPQIQRMRLRIREAANVSADEIFFQSFGQPEELLSVKNEFAREELPEVEDEETTSTSVGSSREYGGYSSLSARSSADVPVSSKFGFSSSHATGHVSQLAPPTHLRTPTRLSLKRQRTSDDSAEKMLPQRKARITLADTTNIVHTNAWQRHGSMSSTSTVSSIVKPFGAPSLSSTSSVSSSTAQPSMMSRSSQPTTAKFPSAINSRMFALR